MNGDFSVISDMNSAVSAPYGSVTVDGSLKAEAGGEEYNCVVWAPSAFTFNGTNLECTGNRGIDITADNAVVLSEQNYAIEANTLKMNVQRATIKGKSGIHIGKDGTLDISGININIEATASNSSGIWSEGNVTLVESSESIIIYPLPRAARGDKGE